MVTGPVAGTVVHEDCGELVIMVDDELFELSGAEHLCRDYVAWHDPVDSRDPAGLELPAGWRPGVVRLAAAA